MANRKGKQEILPWMQAELDQLTKGTTVYGIVTHVSSSGMSRHIKLLTVQDGKIVDISRSAAAKLGWRMAKNREAIVVSGCGMNMVFHTIHELSCAVLGDGYALDYRSL